MTQPDFFYTFIFAYLQQASLSAHLLSTDHKFPQITGIVNFHWLLTLDRQRQNPSLAPKQGAVAGLSLCLDAYLSGAGVVVEGDAGLPVLVEL